jgi:hypothetical protein
MIAVLLALIIIGVAVCLCMTHEKFQLDHYLRRNYESGANMLRGDLPIYPQQQSWFNTRYGPSVLVPGYF